MRPEDMKRIAKAASAGFAMQITAQTDDDERPFDRDWAQTNDDEGPFDRDWAQRMLRDLQQDEDVFQQTEGLDPNDIAPTPEQRAKIDALKDEFPGVMDFSSESDDPQTQRFMGESERIDRQREDARGDADLRNRLREEFGDYRNMFNDTRDIESSSNPSRLVRLAAHLDEFGLHQIADDLDRAAEVEIEDLLESLAHCGHCSKGEKPWSSLDRCPKCNERPCRCKKGKPAKDSVRTAQVALAEEGLDEEDIDLDPADDQSRIISFDPKRNNMVVQSPDGLFKLYEITGESPEGKPRFEFRQIIDSPDDRVSDYSHRLMKGNPSLEGYGENKLPMYLDQLSQGVPDIQNAYASRR